MGHEAVGQFLEYQGDGDLGETLNMPDDATVSEPQGGNAHGDRAAAYAKNGREDRIPLHPILAEAIKRWVEANSLKTRDFFSLYEPRRGSYGEPAR